MISRAQRLLFAFLIISVVVMAAILIRLRERAQDRLQQQMRAAASAAPLVETGSSAPQAVTLIVPNDVDDSLQPVQRNIALPASDDAKARVLLDTLLESFRDPHSTHPVGVPTAADEAAEAASPDVSAGIDEVYLMPVPQGKGTLAVVDFSAAFAASQPSGIEPETLTLMSIIGTLHANIPSITQVRFLIDGHAAETLAGHADLTRTYLAADTPTATGAP
ncbi:MAG TPA: GerMN domain-containing protein [Acidobacteriaceae bacterium]|nr:GerMN domain-containing protein [Acidobacteriaceae bacterium]